LCTHKAANIERMIETAEISLLNYFAQKKHPS